MKYKRTLKESGILLCIFAIFSNLIIITDENFKLDKYAKDVDSFISILALIMGIIFLLVDKYNKKNKI